MPKAAKEPSKERLILVHGILNNTAWLKVFAKRLRAEGYEVHNWGYSSTKKLIEEHAADLEAFIRDLKGHEKIHFVGFSQGAIILRYLLARHTIPASGRFVMIAPPNHGCELAEAFYKYAWFRGIYGDKSIKQLFAKQNDFLQTCGIPKVEFGIMAGGKGNTKGFLGTIPGDNDGTVSVASTRLEGEKDFVLLPHRHTFLIFQQKTVKHAVAFLKTGHFLKRGN